MLGLLGPIKVGIVGLGRIGRVRMDAIERNHNLRLVAVCDPFLSTGAASTDVSKVDDFRQLLDADLDAVFVCTPNAVTPEVVIAALDSGHHVFCEKPPGREVGDVERIIATAESHPNLKLKFGFNHRYHEAVVAARSIVARGRLGPVLWMRGIYGKGTPPDESEWRGRRDQAGGGILLDQGIHMLDLFRHFCGDFDEVRGFVIRAFGESSLEDNAFALLRNRHGQVATLHSSATQWKHTFLLEIFMAHGYAIVNGLLTGTRSYGRESLVVASSLTDGAAPGNPREEVVFFDDDNSWQLEVDDFARCIRNDEPVTMGTSQDALRAMKLVRDIYDADPAWKGQLERLGVLV